MTTPDQLDECRAAAALYSLGALPPAEKSLFEQRLAGGCPFCSCLLEEYASASHELALAPGPMAPAPSLRERLLDSIRQSPSPLPPALQTTVVRKDQTPWRKLRHPGIEIRPLAGDRTLLVRMQPGAVFPTHEHRYAEQCYVLEGSVADGAGLTVYAGDFVSMPAGTTHQPLHTETGCLFLIAYTA